jgi:predicted nucleic acid-binding protein
MRALLCTIDSSCLIALDHLHRITQLSLIFHRIFIPKAVREELFKRRIMKDRLQAIFDEYNFFERCDKYDKALVDVLLAGRSDASSRDRGEVEAVVQAADLGAVVIVDDPWGRTLAELNALDCHGTLWILESFYNLGLMSSSNLRQELLVLRDQGIRLPWKLVNELLARVGEEHCSFRP